MDVEEFIEHHGVMGMKWGVRRANRSTGGSASSHPAKMEVKPAWQRPPAKKITATPVPISSKGRFGKKSHVVLSEEAQQLHAIRLKVKQHGIHSLSNKELETVNKRIDLQQKYQKAHPKKKNPFVELAIDGILSDQGSKKISEFMVKKNMHKNMIGAVEAAIALNKLSRQNKK